MLTQSPALPSCITPRSAGSWSSDSDIADSLLDLPFHCPSPWAEHSSPMGSTHSPQTSLHPPSNEYPLFESPVLGTFPFEVQEPRDRERDEDPEEESLGIADSSGSPALWSTGLDPDLRWKLHDKSMTFGDIPGPSGSSMFDSDPSSGNGNNQSQGGTPARPVTNAWTQNNRRQIAHNRSASGLSAIGEIGAVDSASGLNHPQRDVPVEDIGPVTIEVLLKDRDYRRIYEKISRSAIMEDTFLDTLDVFIEQINESQNPPLNRIEQTFTLEPSNLHASYLTDKKRPISAILSPSSTILTMLVFEGRRFNMTALDSALERNRALDQEIRDLRLKLAAMTRLQHTILEPLAVRTLIDEALCKLVKPHLTGYHPTVAHDSSEVRKHLNSLNGPAKAGVIQSMVSMTGLSRSAAEFLIYVENWDSVRIKGNLATHTNIPWLAREYIKRGELGISYTYLQELRQIYQKVYPD